MSKEVDVVVEKVGESLREEVTEAVKKTVSEEVDEVIGGANVDPSGPDRQS